MSNIIKARVQIRGTRPLLQHQWTEDSIRLPGEEVEKTGTAGKDPEEWKRTCMVTEKGQLYVRGEYVTSMLVAAAVHTKKGKGTLQKDVQSTLGIEEEFILLNRFLPKKAWPLEPAGKCSVSRNPEDPVYIHVCGVVNPATKKRNVRYRLACSAGWIAEFKIFWDKTIINRTQMEGVLRDAAILVGLGNGRKIGMGRFEVTKFEVLDATKAAAA